ncbi:MAG TPA: hypothetical protein VFY12_04525, partial [Arenimonas sp.]|nr:hypothetical protein [Arenimonas sp.]
VLLHSENARAGSWRELTSVRPSKSVWIGPASILVHRVGAETLVIPGGKGLIRATPEGKWQAELLPFRPFGLQQVGPRLVMRNRFSDDGGRSWSKVGNRLRDGAVQFDGQGVAWAASIEESAGGVVRPVLQRSSEDFDDWQTQGPLPGTGVLVVGRSSQLMFLSDPVQAGVLWLSTDQGRHWLLDNEPRRIVEGM